MLKQLQTTRIADELSTIIKRNGVVVARLDVINKERVKLEKELSQNIVRHGELLREFDSAAKLPTS